MPLIYLSPSTQERNLYVNGGTEEEWMNRLADEMEPYLISSGIQFERNTPEMTAVSSIRASNEGHYDLHLSLHSNAAPEGKYGQVRGILVFYYPTSLKGEQCSQIVADNLKVIYPLPDKVRIEPTTTIGEVSRVRAVSCFLELGYHDNLEDAIWIKENIATVAPNVVASLCQYFQIPYLEPVPLRQAVVDISSGALNIRSRPSITAPVIAKAYDGARVTILNQWQGWFLIQFDGVVGYVSSDYVTLV